MTGIDRYIEGTEPEFEGPRTTTATRTPDQSRAFGIRLQELLAQAQGRCIECGAALRTGELHHDYCSASDVFPGGAR